MPQPLVNLVCYEDLGGGLSRDIDVLRHALAEAGATVYFNGWRRRRPKGLGAVAGGVGARARKLRSALSRRPIFDLNVHLETVAEDFLAQASVNALVPNPEWFKEAQKPSLSGIDWVLCKTEQSERIFSDLGKSAFHVGFSSVDRWLPGATEPEPRIRFLHVAGSSLYKGTAAVVEAWRRHPEWPELVLLQSPIDCYGDPSEDLEMGPNVTYLRERIPDGALRQLQNGCAFHLCPSEAEGYGQIIAEGLSCGAVVLSTDGEPMSELVRPEFGCLTQPAGSIPMNLGRRYQIDVGDLARRIEGLVAMTEEERRSRGALARQTWLERRRSFHASLAGFLRIAIDGQGP